MSLQDLVRDSKGRFKSTGKSKSKKRKGKRLGVKARAELASRYKKAFKSSVKRVETAKKRIRAVLDQL